MWAGKDTFANYVVEKFWWEIFKTSTILREILSAFSIEANRYNLMKFSGLIWEYFWNDAISKAILKKIMKSTQKILLINWIRTESDIKIFSSQKIFKLIYIDSDINNRYNRIITRDENAWDKNKSFEEFVRENKNITEKNIQKFKKNADFVIQNNTWINDFYKEIDKLINSLKKEYPIL